MVKMKRSLSSKFHCELCPYETPNSQLFKDHVSSVHAKIKDYVCRECGKAYATKNHLKNHAKALHPDRKFSMDAKLRHKCEICPREFDTQELLGLHNKRHLYHHCPLCDYSTAFTSCLSRHIKQKHLKPAVPKQELEKKDQLNQCPACDYSTPHTNLWLHIRLCHLPKKTFLCDECSYTAKLRQAILYSCADLVYFGGFHNKNLF